MKNYDYLVVGAGLAGATFARKMTDAGKQCLVIDKRWHVAGNCHTYAKEGIEVHAHGPHIFHTSNEEVWKFVNRFSPFLRYRHQVVANIKGTMTVPLPINMNTFARLFNHIRPSEAKDYIAAVQVPTPGDNVEAWCLSNIGPELYTMLVKGYTEKQWGRPATELPASYIKRLPLRFTYDNSYFNDTYEGIPADGYTGMVQSMLEGIEVELGVDYFSNKAELDSLAYKTVYTGMIDELYDFDRGRLAYRSITTTFEEHETPNYQGAAQVNYPGLAPWTRIIEYKHFTNPRPDLPYTIIGREYSEEYNGYNIASYPIHTRENTERAAQYIARAEADGYVVIGRLATYRYLDMWQCIAQASLAAKKELDGSSTDVLKYERDMV